QVQRWDDCEADVRAVLAGQPCPERDGEPYSQEELTIACQEISRSRDVAEAEACALAGTTPTWTKTAVVWAELQTALRKEAVPEEAVATSKDQDDGGPITINTEALDDAKVAGGSTSYGQELPETPL